MAKKKTIWNIYTIGFKKIVIVVFCKYAKNSPPNDFQKRIQLVTIFRNEHPNIRSDFRWQRKYHNSLTVVTLRDKISWCFERFNQLKTTQYPTWKCNGGNCRKWKRIGFCLGNVQTTGINLNFFVRGRKRLIFRYDLLNNKKISHFGIFWFEFDDLSVFRIEYRNWVPLKLWRMKT
jgi:hypothetical protein